MFKSWEKTKIENQNKEIVEAYAPLIISASRSTDIPAFYAEWFFNRLKKGYAVWYNPFNQVPQYISFEKVRLIVFWSKNPKPIIKYLGKLDERNINYYFQFTLNDYEKEGLEQGVPKLSSRIDTFKKLSEKIGKEKLLWRFDPLILTENIDTNKLIDKIENVGNHIYKYTEKLIISFADIEVYKKVKANLKRSNINYKDFDNQKITEIVSGITKLNKIWKLKIATCCEKIEMNEFGIEHNKCIDDDLIIRLFNKDKVLIDFLGYEEPKQKSLFASGEEIQRPYLKDKGQRKLCGCIVSKDIGQYNTCLHLCTYCYANTSEKVVKDNYKKVNKNSESIICKGIELSVSAESIASDSE